ncbi:GDSL-type esterase/lipase family protein [uncultured Pontibacter sp.]|uniref:GDSL-type esterase/lipase family protein n=1 Tax=uncultured Pontibacter sp. TaxID=453356 RepID=UPI00261882A3|nr:GDSL-type esterase/lipase family protein [uncultured Pontibacter sp.]
MRIAFKALLLLLLSVVTFEIFAQVVAWDSTFRPATYHVQVEQHKAYPASRKDIVFLGNSLTAHPNWNELLKNKHVKNRGISGDITYGVLERLDDVIAGKPAKLFILIGINDISRNIPDSLILQNYKKIVARVKAGSPATKIYLQTMLPTNNNFDKFKRHYNKEEHVSYLNKEIKELGEKEKVTVVDLHPAFSDGEGRLKQEYTHDGLHLTAEGYKVWARVLLEGKHLK